MVHQIFHSEHNRLAHDIDRRINTPIADAAGDRGWHGVHAGSGWNYEERLFQAARFATEMQYQHLVFEEFARTVQPLIDPFLGRPHVDQGRSRPSSPTPSTASATRCCPK